MFSLTSSHRYQLYKLPCDMRKSFDALSGLVTSELSGNPTGGDVFVFLNKRRDRLKLLHWEPGGFVLYYKRLERGTFTPPGGYTENGAISWPQLVLMIEGIQVYKSRQKARFYQ